MPYKDTASNLRKELHQKRSDMGVKCQPSFNTHINELNAITNKYGSDPYDLDFATRSEMINKVEFYAKGGNWNEAFIKDGTIFHRLERLPSFISRHTNDFKDVFDGGYGIALPKTHPGGKKVDLSEPIIEDFFNNLIDIYSKNGKWLQLNKLLHKYNAHRDISWWTNSFEYAENNFSMPKFFTGYDITYKNKWIVDFAHHVGMANDWLHDYLIFMKFNSSDSIKSSVKVPSIIDAYDQLIFFPCNESDIPPHGLALHINETIRPNYREFILTQVPIDKVSFILVKINTRDLKIINPYANIDDDLLNRLINLIV